MLSEAVMEAQSRSDEPVPVILVAGQSNADGRVPMADFPKGLQYEYCQWSYGSGDFETATGTFSTYSPRVAKPGIERSWGFDAVVYYQLEQLWQRPFYVIKHTDGGTAIDPSCKSSTHGLFWSADKAFLDSTTSASHGGKSLLKAFCRQIDDCLPNLPRNYDIKCLIWHQGESDQQAAASYHDNLQAVIAYVRQHLVKTTGCKRYAQLPVICGTFSKDSRQGSPVVADALRRLSREDRHFHVVEATDLPLLRDRLHFNAQGAQLLGARVYDTLRQLKIAYSPESDAFKDIWPVTDKSLMRSLNGEWQLKVVKGVTADKTVPAADNTWSMIPVPGCWEAYGFCEPKYNYPDSLTGYYRTSFTLPRSWKGQQIVIRLDGVLRGYDLWLNDQLVGTWESGYNTCLFDLTPYLSKKAFKGEPQQLAMRVYSHFKGYEFDCFDDWATMGIFRDVTIFPVPKTHLSDLTVETKMNGEVKVKTMIANATRHTNTDYEMLDADGSVVSTGEKIKNPHLWTAETPYLYTLRVRVCEKGKTLQTFEQKIGIRELSIDGNVLKLNGQPIKLRGVNTHSTDPYTVKVISDDLTLKDMKLMKEASVNYMRLSHYPREPRFYELADSLGFYLVDEVPFGYGDKHLGSRKYQDILKTRSLATVSRDKNHPSVLVWSVGNENPLPQTCVEVGDYVGRLDPSRPYCFPQVGSYFRKFWEAPLSSSPGGKANNPVANHPFPSLAPVYAPHYPTTGQIGGFYQHLDRPVIFTEYCHTLGISFEDHDRQWEMIERTPGIAGGSVWEWADQGMPFFESEKRRVKSEKIKWRTDGSERDQKVYTSETGGFEMKGNFGTDGLLYADRTPLPNYYELQHNYARAFVRSVDCDSVAATLSLVNRYDFLNLRDAVTFHWYLTADRDTVARGTFSTDCPPRSSVPYTLALPPSRGGERETSLSLCLLHFDLEDKQGHTFLHQSFVLNKPQESWTGTGTPMQYVQETVVRTGRKATMAERITQKGRLLGRYLLPLDNAQVKADIQKCAIDGGEEITFTLTPDTADVFRSELGLAYLLDAKIDRVQWIGYGPFASYPGRHQANRYGFWAKHQDDLYFEGNHGGIDAALLTDSLGNGILIVPAGMRSREVPDSPPLEGLGESLSLNFEQTDRGIVLTVNAAVSGQGPKFAKTAFPGWTKGDGPVSATFRIYSVMAGEWPAAARRLFAPTIDVPAPFRPFLTQYDTYLLRYNDIVDRQKK
jgi:beta-galactosidase